MNNYSRSNYFNPTFYPYNKIDNRYKRLINEYDNTYHSRNISEVTLKYGSNGVEVEELQNILILLNYLKGKADGFFGKNTEKAVLNFQKDTNQVMDGIVGPNTWALLERATNTPLPVNEPTVKKGDKNLFVTNLQLKLNALGYLSEEPDGNFGIYTEKAVKDFQKAYNLPADGIAGPKTWRSVNKAYSSLESSVPIIITPMLGGTTGEEVKILQQNLKDLGYYQGEITGNFDVSTGNSVQKFQEANELLPTGIVNQKTWEIIEEKLSSNRLSNHYDHLIRQKKVLLRPTLRVGDTGEDVRDLQFYLKELMYLDGSIDNKFGNDTNKAVRAFQANNKLSVDGIVGRNTWSALVDLYSPLAICDTGDNDRYVGVVIDAGHGGEDPGAVSPEITEKDFNLKISQYMANRFAELGIPYALTRNSDETLTNAERIRRLKTPFGDISNAIVISNHINAGGGEGAEVIYPLRSNSILARNILTELGNSGQKMRTYYQKTLPSDPTKDYYYIMRDTDKLQTIITEYGFLDNPSDISKLKQNWDLYAEAVVKAIAEYMGYPYSLSEEKIVTYIVRPGDSLWAIANLFGTTVDAIKKLNNLTSNNLSIGQQLIISGEGVNGIPPSGSVIYTVKAGDTLYSIAKKYNMTVDEIKRTNNLTSNNLSIGQQLTISGNGINVPETKPTIYTVKAGDTLWAIANNYGVSIDTIKRINNLSSNDLSIGQQLIISEEYIEEVFPYNNEVYIVKSGDTLWSIANRFGTTVDELKRINNLTNNSLSIGQELLIPGNVIDMQEPTEQIYTVQSGDTLWSIANRFGTTVNELKRINNLTNNALSIGQQIKIPNF